MTRPKRPLQSLTIRALLFLVIGQILKLFSVDDLSPWFSILLGLNDLGAAVGVFIGRFRAQAPLRLF